MKEKEVGETLEGEKNRKRCKDNRWVEGGIFGEGLGIQPSKSIKA